MENLTGKQLNQYQIFAPLGEGGMAAVYKAYQPSMERYVALKILPRQFANDLQFMGRFEQEAKVIASLQHPHILPVFDYGEAEGYTFIVMPFVETGTLSDILLGQPLPVAQIVSITAQVGDALDYAHSRGIVHRDIKPSNILIDERGNCLLADFGIAKIVEGTAQFTFTGGIVGTPAYMSPEQGLGITPDGRSDIYSFGVILYEMATGRPPYNAETPMAVVIKHIHDPLPPPRTINPHIPEALEQIILKSLAKKQDERYATFGDLVQSMQSITHPTPESAATLIEPTPAIDTLIETPALDTVTTVEESFLVAKSPIAQTRERPQWVPWVIAVSGVLGLGVIATILGWLFFGLFMNNGDVQPVSELILPTNTQAVIEIIPATQTDSVLLVVSETTEPTETAKPTETHTSMPEPTPSRGDTMVSPVDGSVLVFVPAGEFIMGSDPEEPHFWGAEAPKHDVYLDAFWIHRTEVTNAMYSDCVAARACPAPQYYYSRTHTNYFNNPDFADFPVIHVTHSNAQAYCQWAGVRLPTEAEWEKAARGTDGRLYPWGNQELASNLANFCDVGCPNTNPEEIESALNDGFQDVAPVGSFPNGASPYGALDMAGNVLEWVADWYEQSYYAQSPYENPTGPKTGIRHPIRGGSWYSGRAGLRSAARASLTTDGVYETLGFRCAMDAE